MKIYRQYLLFVITCILNALPAFSQDYIVNFQSYGVEDGLLHREVNALYQDSRGFIWLGTKGGLNRFDGYSFKSWTVEKDSFLNNEIWQILEDADGFLWLPAFVPAQDFDIWNPQTGERTTFRQKFGDKVFALQPNFFVQSELDKSIFFSTDNPPGIASYHPKTGLQFFPIAGFKELRIMAAKQNVWCIGDQTKLMEISRDGRILQQFSHEGKIEFSLLANTSVPFVYSENIFDVNSKLYYLNEQRERVLISDNFPSQRPFLFRLSTPTLSEDLIWNDFRLFNLRGQKVFSLDSVAPSIVSGGNRSILVDKQGNIWSGGNYGVHAIHLQKNRFDTYLASGTENHSVRGMLVLNNYLFVNDEVNGLYIINTETGKSRSAGRLQEWGHYALSVIDSKTVVAGDRSSLFFLKKDGSPKPEETIRLSARIWAFYRSSDAKLWVGTEQGLYLVDLITHEWQPYKGYHQFEDLAKAHVFHIEADEKGRLWICTNLGLFMAEEERGIQARYWTGGKGLYHLPHNIIYHFHKEKSQAGKAEIFWLASGGGGLIRWEPQTGQSIQYTKSDGLSNNVIYAVYGDNYGNLWLSSDYGIIRFDKNTGATKTYLTKDGVGHNEFNRIAHFQDETGKIYFGGLNGITAFDPSDFLSPDSSYDPPLAITSFYQFDGNKSRLIDNTSKILQSNKIALNPNDRFFRLEFALLTYRDVNRNNYAYRVEGIDEEWNYQSERTLRFGRLPYGDYTLRVKGQDATGKWSKNELAIPITVLRPFYLQTWFLFTTGLFIVFGSFTFYKFRTGQLKRQKRLLEAEVFKRTDTIQKQKEKLESQANELIHLDELKSRFFANVSHELRTPLTLLLGPISSLLNDKQLKRKELILLQLMRKNGQDLLKLINELLDLSKLEAGKLELHEESVSLHAIIEHQLSQYESLAHKLRVQLVFDYRAKEYYRVLLDKNKFEKILSNLLSNALKHTPSEGRITIRLQELSNAFQLVAEDSGRGIHPDDLPHIFDRFYQSNRPGIPTEGGAGIGLALCREIAKLMDGKIWAKSELGKGSTFTFEFPKKEVIGGKAEMEEDRKLVNPEHELPEITAPSFAPAKQMPNSQASTILLVEDNSNLQEFLHIILREKYNVLIAENGQVAWEMLTLPPNPPKGELPPTLDAEGGDSPFGGLGGKVDLIISDLMMPIMDGFQLLEKLKGSDEWRHVPIIMLTARADLEDKLKALRIGVDDYLVKPFEEEELLARIENLLQNYHSRQRAFDKEEKKATPSLVGEDLLWLEKLEDLVQNNMANYSFSVDDIWSELTVSRSQLFRKIKLLTGITPHQYIKEVRFHHARKLLETRTYSTIKTVAHAIGMKDIEYFSNQFRKFFGKLPSDYLS